MLLAAALTVVLIRFPGWEPITLVSLWVVGVTIAPLPLAAQWGNPTTRGLARKNWLGVLFSGYVVVLGPIFHSPTISTVGGVLVLIPALVSAVLMGRILRPLPDEVHGV